MQARRTGKAGARPRRRRTADEARDLILDAAERRLLQGGPAAVRVQVIARDVGVTDAAVHHHFGSRAGLLEALLRRAGRKLKNEIARAVAGWPEGSFEVAQLMRLIQRTYGEKGFARLTAFLLLSGYQPAGSGMYRGLAEAIHRVRVERAKRARRPAPSLDDSLFAVSLLNAVLWAEPLAGAAMRRAVSLPPDKATAQRYRNWIARLLQDDLERSP